MNIKIKYVGICGSDILRLEMGQDVNTLGHEIVAQSTNKLYWAVNPLLSCGKCDYCKTGRTRFCKQLRSYGKDLHGGFSGGIINVRNQNLIKITDDNPIPYILADTLASVIHALNYLPINAGRVLIIGDGAMATLFVYNLASLNIDFVQAIKNTNRKNRVYGNHNVTTFDKLENEVEEKVFDTVIVAVGGRSALVLNIATRLLKPSGVLIIAGAYYLLEDELHIKTILTKEISLIGSYSHEPSDFKKAVEVIKNDIIFFNSIISDVIESENINQAFTFHSTKQDRIKIAVSFN